MPTGFTGTTEYTAANSAGFTAVASHLTNGVDEDLELATAYYNSAGSLVEGHGGISLESFWFGLPSDLQGDTIDFIRRIVSTNSTAIGIELGTDVEYRFEIWGTSRVPEPGTLILISVGLAAFAILRRCAIAPEH